MTSPPLVSDHDMLEHLRRQATKVGELEACIAQLELQQRTLKASADQLEQQLQEYRRIKDEWDWFFEHALDMLVIHDCNGRIERVNPAVERVLGYTPAEFTELDMADMIHPDDLRGTLDHIAAIAGGMDGLNFASRSRHKDGSWRWISWTTPAPSRAAGTTTPTYAVGRDITASRMTELELLHRAQHDALTGLANRAMFDQSFEQAIARAQRRPGSRVTLMLLDLDGFKGVNDTQGHLAGDAVLKAVATRLHAAQRVGDVVARLGGDEFGILLEDAPLEATDTVARRIIGALGESIAFGDVPLTVGCSIGIATWPDCASNSGALFECADRAMYQVKRSGKCNFLHYCSAFPMESQPGIDTADTTHR